MKKIFLLSVAVLFVISATGQSAVNLKLNPEKNKVYRFNSASNQTIIQIVNGNQQTVESKTDYTVSLKMIDATSDFMVTEVHIDTMKTVTNSMGRSSVMTSAKEGDIKSAETSDIVSCILNRLTKNPLYVKMDFSGKPVEIVNLKMLSDVILKDTGSMTITGPLAASIKKQVADLISDKTLKNLVGTFTSNLPGRQVAPGESWNRSESTNSGGMALDITTSYHLDGVKDNSAAVTAEAEIKAAANADPIMSGGAKITYDDLKGLSKFTMTVDILTGLILEEKAKTHIAGNLSVSAPGVSMQIPMEISGESKVTALQ
jgi:hypothetical protein